MLQSYRGQTAYVLEDPQSGQFFQIGPREERLLRQLDGSRTGLELLAELQAMEGAEGGEGKPGLLDCKGAMHLLSMLYAAGLLENAPPPPAPPKSVFRSLVAKNPLFIKLPAGNPDRLLAELEARLRFLFSPAFALVLIALGVAGFLSVASDWARFTDRAQSVLAAENWLWLLVSFIVLKAVHELGHGLICKHHGGRVPEFGFYFMLFTPLTYVDATSSWAFPSKFTRILVSSGGMIAELGLASIAAIVWSNTETGVLNTLAYNMVVSATVVTLLFNLNPLLRYDGYFILSDLTEVPNLYAHAGSIAGAWLRFLFFGTPVEIHDSPWIGIYGLACMVWRALIIVAIAVGAVVLLEGIGMVLVAVYVAGVSLPLIKTLKSVPAGRERKRGILSGVVILLVAAIPVRQSIMVPGVVQPEGMTPVRVECPGFLRELLVAPGDPVEAGQLLARIENPEELSRLRVLQTSALIAEAEAHAHRLKRESQLEARKSEDVRSLKLRADERAAYCETMNIRAPVSGIVIGRDTKNLPGSFLEPGFELFGIGSPTGREVQIFIPEDYGRHLQGRPGDKVTVFLKNHSQTRTGVLLRIEARAGREIRHPEVTALAGGPLAVRKKESDTPDKPDSSGMELVDPHFVATVLLDPSRSGHLRGGETSLARLHSSKTEPLAVFLWNAFERFLRGKFDAASAHG